MAMINAGAPAQALANCVCRKAPLERKSCVAELSADGLNAWYESLVIVFSVSFVSEFFRLRTPRCKISLSALRKDSCRDFQKCFKPGMPNKPAHSVLENIEGPDSSRRFCFSVISYKVMCCRAAEIPTSMEQLLRFLNYSSLLTALNCHCYAFATEVFP